MSFSASLIQLRRDVAGAALAVAGELEAGRATAPFRQRLSELARADAEVPVRAAILADRPESLHALLSEVVGHDYKVCKVVVPSRLGYSEIQLQERGFVLDSGAGPREFADVGAFLGALESSHALPAAEGDGAQPLRFGLMGPAQLSGLCLLVPHSLEALLRKPALLSTLTDQADWMFLAGSAEATIEPEARQAIQLVLEHVTGLQNVLVATADRPPDAPVAAAAAATTAWHKGWKVTLSLGLVRQGSDLLRERLSLLTAPGSELRRYLVEVRLWRQLDATLQLMEEELALSQRSAASRLHLAKEGLLGDAGSGETRKAAERLRTRLAEDADNLLKAAEREARAALGPEGELHRRLGEAAQALTVEDIDQTHGEVAIKLTLGGDAGRRLADLVASRAQARLGEVLRQTREGLECSVREAEAGLEKLTGMRHRLSWEIPDETALASSLVSARPELRYRGEMPRPTLASRFGSARSAMMGLMILGTLVGSLSALSGDSAPGAGGGARAVVTSIMVPALILSFLWTYVSFRKQERLTLEKELERLAEGVAGELRRAMSDAFRDQQAALQAAVQRVLRDTQTQVEAALEKTAQLRQREQEELRRRQADQQRTAEQRRDRLRQFSQQLAGLRPRIAEARKVQQQWLGAWIEGFNRGRA